MTLAYYNEWEPYPAQWLRNLIAAGHIAPGDVDERDIREVSADDLRGYGQAHWFAGIAGWSYAARLAGIRDDEPIWTGSCPCQPFSQAGQRKGTTDERHLWPEFRRLIAGCRPARVFGEQTQSPLGRQWLAGVQADLEALGYQLDAADLCAAGVGAPHIRQRLWWVANASGARLEGRQIEAAREERETAQRSSDACGLANTMPAGRAERRSGAGNGQVAGGGSSGGMGNASELGSWRNSRAIPGAQTASESEWKKFGREPDEPQSPGFWSEFEIIPCADGKARRVKSGIFPLATGIPNRIPQLRAIGNSINPEIAAEFMRCAP